MEIDDTIQMLTRIRQSIDTWVPKRTAGPDALIAHLDKLYVESTENRDFDEVFEYDDVGCPSITLIVGIEGEFDLQRVMDNMRTRLHIVPPCRADEIGTAGIVSSHGRYDFVYDHALEYLENVKATAKENIGDPETE